jgi:hypothetical protein
MREDRGEPKNGGEYRQAGADAGLAALDLSNRQSASELR